MELSFMGFLSSRYLRLLPDGRLLYAMALDTPRKALKWFNTRTMEQKEKDRGREKSAQNMSICPSLGTSPSRSALLSNSETPFYTF